MIFLYDIFSGARGVLKSLRNHEAGSAACHQQQPAEMADCWWGPIQRKIKSRMMIKYIAFEFVQARQFGLKANTILGTKLVDGTVRESSSEDPTRVADLGGSLSTSVTSCMCDPECCQDSKHRRGRGTAVIQRKYWSSEVNKSIAIATIDRTAPR